MKQRISEHGAQGRKRFLPRAARVLALIGGALLIVIALIAFTGFIWNTLTIRHYRQRYPAPGSRYAVDGGMMHIYCTGSGSPALMLDSGVGDDWTAWIKVQPQLSKTTQVCSFDRSGLGSSDVLRGGHDADTLAEQLHTLIRQAGVKTPFVLAGHSMAGLYDRAYAAKYPNDLAGLILIDAVSPDQAARMPKETAQKLSRFSLAWDVWRTRLGIARAKGECDDVMPGFEATRHWALGYFCDPSVLGSTYAEVLAQDRSDEEVRRIVSFGRLPVLIISQDPDRPLATTASYSQAIVKQVRVTWNQLQEELKQLSSNNRRVIAKGSGHYIPVDRADLLDREIPMFIEQIRSGAPSPDNGTTKTE
jgi:pimeloyl-ACP methyl ester carboxylesterase